MLAALVKTQVKELKAFKDKEQSGPNNTNNNTNISSQFNTSGLEATLVPILSYSTESIVSLQYLQALFQVELSVENLLALITT